MTQEDVDLMYDYMHENYEYKDGTFTSKKTGKLLIGNICHKATKLCCKLNIKVNNKKWSIQYNHAVYIYFNKKKAKYLDYKDGNSANNSIDNIIETNMSMLGHALERKYKNKIGLQGVVKMGNKFHGVCYKNYKKIYSKACDTPMEAHFEYLKLKKNINK